MKLSEKKYKRVVVKIGSSLLCAGRDSVDQELVAELVRQFGVLARGGLQLLIVSSGAIALGVEALKLKYRPKETAFLQAAAALGQNLLMDSYSRAGKDAGVRFAQVLLTWDDFTGRSRYLNAKNTLAKLLELGVVPVINENDTVSTEEIRFGDNDRLSALVASLVSADLLIILSDVDGLLDREKRLVRLVRQVTAEIRALACPTQKKSCVGGMVTKLEAAKICLDSGIDCLIANGRKNGALPDALKDPAGSGTLFLSGKGLPALKRWVAFGARPKGSLIVDDGARKALLAGKSLLVIGITGVEGNFSSGEVVGIKSKDGSEFARGKAGLGSPEIERALGRRHGKEAIHRDNIVVF